MRLHRNNLGVFALTVACATLASCGGGGESQNPPQISGLDNDLLNVITASGLTGDPSVGRNLPSIDDPIAQLGKLLFFSKALGGDKDSACVTCHHPVLGGGDGLSIAIGVGAVNPDLLGPGRTHDPFAIGWDGGPTMPRNVPSTFNSGMFDQVMFWDGRIDSMGKTPSMNGADGAGIRTPDTPLGIPDANAGDTLPVALARFPVTVNEEMRGFLFEAGNDNDAIRNHLAARLGNYGIGAGELQRNDWLRLFQLAYHSTANAETLITYANIAKAIGDYGRSQVFVHTPWKAYVQGEKSAISDSAKRGALLFFRPITSQNSGDPGGSSNPIRQTGAGCASCHKGDFFTDEQSHVVAIPQIGRGKGDGDYGDDDFGRFRETAVPADKYAFRTPTLLNVTVTGPWGHSGAYETLEGIVRHHLNVEQTVVAFDYSKLSQAGIQTEHAVTNTQNALNQLLANRTSGTLNTLQNVTLTDNQVNDLLAFLATLTDPCVQDRQCLSPWIPGDNEPDPDGLRVKAVDGNGKPL